MSKQNMLPETLDDALYITIHQNEKPLKAIAEEVGMSPSYLTRSALPDTEDCESGSGCRFPAKKIVPLIKASNNYLILDYLEHAVRRVAFKLPGAHICGRDICRQAMRATKEFGELMGQVEMACEDGTLTRPERENIAREAYHTIEAVCGLLAMVKKGGGRV